DQYAGGVPEQGICSCLTASQFRSINNIVMQQSRGMNELHDCGQIVMIFTAIAERAGGKDYQRRPQALPAAVDDIFAYLPDECYFGVEFFADNGIHRA